MKNSFLIAFWLLVAGCVSLTSCTKNDTNTIALIGTEDYIENINSRGNEELFCFIVNYRRFRQQAGGTSRMNRVSASSGIPMITISWRSRLPHRANSTCAAKIYMCTSFPQGDAMCYRYETSNEVYGGLRCFVLQTCILYEDYIMAVGIP